MESKTLLKSDALIEYRRIYDEYRNEFKSPQKAKDMLLADVKADIDKAVVIRDEWDKCPAIRDMLFAGAMNYLPNGGSQFTRDGAAYWLKQIEKACVVADFELNETINKVA